MSGFTDPDPAVPDSGDDDPPDFPAEVTEDDEDAKMMVVDADASCLRCSHFEVCAIFSGIRPMMQDWHTEDSDDAEAPIDLEKLAWHCRKYDPVDDSDFVDQTNDI